MDYQLKPMDETCARAIAGWHYEGIYAFYDMDQDPEDLAELLDPGSWSDRYYAVIGADGALVGFFYLERKPEGVEIGLGLRPDLTGQGTGLTFLEAGLSFARKRYGPVPFWLSVATFNERAIRLYRNAGFEDAGVFMQQTNGGRFEFLRMVKAECPPQEGP